MRKRKRGSKLSLPARIDPECHKLSFYFLLNMGSFSVRSSGEVLKQRKWTPIDDRVCICRQLMYWSLERQSSLNIVPMDTGTYVHFSRQWWLLPIPSIVMFWPLLTGLFFIIYWMKNLLSSCQVSYIVKISVIHCIKWYGAQKEKRKKNSRKLFKNLFFFYIITNSYMYLIWILI